MVPTRPVSSIGLDCESDMSFIGYMGIKMLNTIGKLYTYAGNSTHEVTNSLITLT
jgi:hypothetical protein